MIAVEHEFNLTCCLVPDSYCAYDFVFADSCRRRAERYSSREYDDEFTFSVRRRCDHVVEVPLCSVDGGMSGPTPVSHHVAVAEEFVEVGEIALAGFT